MKNFLLRFFTWWNGATVGTLWFTRRVGQFVGEDEFGNRYYRAVVAPLGERRWVIYAGVAEASRIPTGWHGWMHHTVDVPPSQEQYVAREWQRPHRPNMTGTAEAYRPPGSILTDGRSRAKGDYEAWSPGG